MTKRCTKCSIDKPLSEFHKRTASPGGYRPICKACALIWWRDYRAKNPDAPREANMKSKYGMTIDQYNMLLLRQKGVCAICGAVPVLRNLDVDHSHENGAVRGLLCLRCNSYLLGNLERVGMAKVLSYLEEHEDIRPY